MEVSDIDDLGQSLTSLTNVQIMANVGLHTTYDASNFGCLDAILKRLKFQKFDLENYFQEY